MATKIIIEIWTDGKCSPGTAHDLGAEAVMTLRRRTSLSAELVGTVVEHVEPHDIHMLDEAERRRIIKAEKAEEEVEDIKPRVKRTNKTKV